MAAISAIVLSDPPHVNTAYEEERKSAPAHLHNRTVGLPIPNEALRYTISSDGIHLPRAGPTQASRVSNDSPVPPASSAPPIDLPTEPTGDSMEVDRNDLDDDSDNDTEQGESSSVRKKKGQRFFCTGYPPCNLSFTRSEHLARHIRKHTGERPFQCHCNRRFSRLDNLRQHAQTVHVNEEIPADSLAATGTRFQRQIRTDRVRPAGRPRTGTMSSIGSHSRGHSRNLSASSVGSTSSSYSTSTTDSRRRPPPLVMAGDGRSKSGLDYPSTPPAQFASYSTHSPNDVGTPGSSTFSPLDHSPGFGPAVLSPLLPGPRTGFYSAHSTPARRLSVPSGSSPYQPSYGPPQPPLYSGQPGYPGPAISSSASSVVSPTSSTFSLNAGPGFHVPPSEDWRRRTWHPSTYSGANFNYSRPATSGLTYSQTPDAPQPAYAFHAAAAAGQAPRLPGIESFDQVQQPSNLAPRQAPPAANSASSSTLMPAIDFEPHGPRVQASSDTLRQSHFARSENVPTFDRNSSSWVAEAGESTLRSSDAGSRSSPETMRNAMMGPPPGIVSSDSYSSANQDSTRSTPGHSRAKRQGWYNGPPAQSRTSPEDSSSSDGVPTPGTSGLEIQPAIVHSNGMVEPHHAILNSEGANNTCYPQNHGLSSYVDIDSRARSAHQRTGSNNLDRLEALVAVATNETASSRNP